MPYIVALLTFALARRVYDMEYAVEKARDLGSYQLVARIGEGGMGEVWRASHRMLAREAAVKLIRGDLMLRLPASEAETLRARFEREAQAIASLSCPHTVFLYDFGVARDGCFYYVMELLNGVSLASLVEKHGPQPAARVAYVLGQVCQSLEEAHRRGLIHRDIKPSNIFIGRTGLEYDFAKVLDFGLVKSLAPDYSQHLTVDGRSAGTPAYMAPEVAMGDGVVDGRADLYALGCVAYYLLTGQQVFEEKTATAAALAHVQKTPVPPSHRSELAIPPELERVVLDCLAKKPADRPASATELERRLAACSLDAAWTQAEAAEWWQTYRPESAA
jgi:serine/threonine-protein kinase